jgi:hypothetical protein
MAAFKSLKEYLVAHMEGRAAAILPLQLVANHLEVTRAAIDRMVKVGHLKGIKIRGSKFVDAQSLLDREASQRADLRKVRNYLERLARRNQQPVFYEPVMNIIGRETGIPADRNYIGVILGKLSEATDSESGTLLSVLVHKKTVGRTRPGRGFFNLAKSLGRKWADEDELVKVETRKVLAYYKRSAAD